MPPETPEQELARLRASVMDLLDSHQRRTGKSWCQILAEVIALERWLMETRNA